jgi:large subunit ribosomal protein L4
MKVNVVDTKGNKIEEITLKKDIFGVEPHAQVLAQYVRVFLANQRQGTSSTKTRGEVSGGGKKPWKQKGTGRARVGSTRNPIWVHGGVAHGPKPKDWSLKLPKKMKQLAMFSVLSSALAENRLTVLDKFEVDKPQTKIVAGVLKDLDLKGKTLVVLDTTQENLVQSAKNVKDLETAPVSTLNAFQVMRAKNVVFLKDAILSIQKKYENK